MKQIPVEMPQTDLCCAQNLLNVQAGRITEGPQHSSQSPQSPSEEPANTPQTGTADASQHHPGITPLDHVSLYRAANLEEGGMTDDRSTSQVFLGKKGMAQPKINLPLQQGRAEVRSENITASTVGGGVRSAPPTT